MSFRIEQKILIEKNQIIEFKKLYKEKSIKKLYPSRIIRSLYLENLNKDMYANSIEGVVPRKKIRIRNYPNEKNGKFYLEKKYPVLREDLKRKRKLIF